MPTVPDQPTHPIARTDPATVQVVLTIPADQEVATLAVPALLQVATVHLAVQAVPATAMDLATVALAVLAAVPATAEVEAPVAAEVAVAAEEEVAVDNDPLNPPA